MCTGSSECGTGLDVGRLHERRGRDRARDAERQSKAKNSLRHVGDQHVGVKRLALAVAKFLFLVKAKLVGFTAGAVHIGARRGSAQKA